MTVLKLSGEWSIYYVLGVTSLNQRVIRVFDLVYWTTLPVTSIEARNISTIPGLGKEGGGGREEEVWGNKGGRRREGEGCVGRKEKGGGGGGGGGEEEGMNNKEKQ